MQIKTNFDIQNTTDLLLDEKTANVFMILSDDLKRASCSETRRSQPKLPQRFTFYNQVMSTASISHGRHYWEVEVSDCGLRYVAVCYPSMNRVGKES
ncbi:unnamed protein product, partial [Staurois parvus]